MTISDLSLKRTLQLYVKNAFEGQKNGFEKTSKDAIIIQPHMLMALARMRREEQKKIETSGWI